jgi:murein DD-endopeptidase MepM/ murein hydrolase activator NlpD
MKPISIVFKYYLIPLVGIIINLNTPNGYTQVNKSVSGISIEEGKKISAKNELLTNTLIEPSEAVTGVPILGHEPCLSATAKAELLAEIAQNKARLVAEGKLASTPKPTLDPIAARAAAVLPTFQWPTRARAGYPHPGYYTIQNFVDHNLSFPNQIRDYECGSRSYDFAGGNHEGTDIILWPFPWKSMDEGVMEVVAAAPGVIISLRNGNPDRSCINQGSTLWNGVILQHADGTQSWYLHFTTGSVTNKLIGDSVVAGEYLGVAGSSGSSNWPHLHFQVTDSFGRVIDPFAGACNPTATASLWQRQPNYLVPTVNRLVTKKSIREFYRCPTPELTYAADTFRNGDTLATFVYYRDLPFNSVSTTRLINPLGQILTSFNFRSQWATITTAYQYWYYLLSTARGWIPGTWRWEFDFGGTTYSKTFVILGATANTHYSHYTPLRVWPLPASKNLFIDGLASGHRYELVSVTGAVVVAGVGNGKTLELPLTQNPSIITSPIASGVYTLRARGYAPQKVVVE